MDVGTLNDIGITLAGVIGVALFYFIGKKSFDKDQRRQGSGKKSGQDSCPWR
ncbi:MAG: hypothetical protein IK061_02875 [Desulfovibrio sp.]|nr:hypothetical protein [Desulfovibrio sp.]